MRMDPRFTKYAGTPSHSHAVGETLTPAERELLLRTASAVLGLIEGLDAVAHDPTGRAAKQTKEFEALIARVKEQA